VRSPNNLQIHALQLGLNLHTFHRVIMINMLQLMAENKGQLILARHLIQKPLADK